ncbi:UDP-glucuronosyltransferase 1A5-like [Cheilinus undulatus]|uniref:UDP-glucuronosyltransferase 1A5-like n=1 Tax=Cheilinus undulatus TaxID=241271 RepID=UPI001BD55F92|nr:UDP-glucuronosyltransferase 1A5-like [Cheilinus undulatus]
MESMPVQRVCGILVLLGLCLVSFTPCCDGGNILVFPLDWSHWINMKILLVELHTRGHNITVIRPSNSWYIDEKSPLYTSISFPMKETETPIDDYIKKNIMVQREGASLITILKLIQNLFAVLFEIHTMWVDMIGNILDDKNVVQSLLDAKYDLVLTDPATVAGLVLAKHLKLPSVLNVRWIPAGDGHYVIAPSPLSYVPSLGSGLTDKMTFIQRVKNFFYHGVIEYQQRFLLGPRYESLCDKYIEGGCSVTSLLQDADIWLFRSDFVFDFPRPTMPNVVYMGGFQCKKAQPLPADLEDFVQSAGEHRVIIMSLGSMVDALPEDLADAFARVFAKMPQKVIWKHKGKTPSTLGNNTLMVDWMPQKDLLGHPQTKAFVAHGGTNGVQEAIYHGVPVLGIPLFFDQYDNLLRLQERGAGKILELAYANEQSFEQMLKEVLYQDSYRQNIQRLSRLHRDLPLAPMDQAVFWVEYVIRHKGAPHLRTEAYKMPWYSYHSLDVLLVLMTAVTVLLLSALAVLRFLCCRCRRKSKTKQH